MATGQPMGSNAASFGLGMMGMSNSPGAIPQGKITFWLFFNNHNSLSLRF